MYQAIGNTHIRSKDDTTVEHYHFVCTFAGVTSDPSKPTEGKTATLPHRTWRGPDIGASPCAHRKSAQLLDFAAAGPPPTTRKNIAQVWRSKEDGLTKGMLRTRGLSLAIQAIRTGHQGSKDQHPDCKSLATRSNPVGESPL